MATNVTEKDKTLHEVIDFLEKEWDAANNASDNPDEEEYDFYDGMTTAYEHAINYCRHMLGYYGDERTLMNMGVFEELLNEGWKILRVDTMPPTELRDTAVTATNVYILEREANDD